MEIEKMCNVKQGMSEFFEGKRQHNPILQKRGASGYQYKPLQDLKN